MAFGPIFLRELQTGPRRVQYFVLRAAFVTFFFVLVWTAWQSIVGFDAVERAGDFAYFHSIVFPLLARVQLAIVLFLSGIYGANSISIEKDRRTLVLLMMTRLKDREIVVEKFLCGLLNVGALLLAGLPLFMLLSLLGGISGGEILLAFAISIGSAVLADAIGVTIACWRDRSFQAVALTIMAVALWLLGAEVLSAFGETVPVLGSIAEVISPYRALNMNTIAIGGVNVPGGIVFLLFAVLAALGLLTYSTIMLRRWYPVGEPIVAREPEPYEEAAKELKPKKEAKYRVVTGNPILWRETRTRAYGTRPILIKIGFLAIAAILVAMTWNSTFGRKTRSFVNEQGETVVVSETQGRRGSTQFAFTTLVVASAVLALLLINTQSVSAITTERDLKAIDLLLATRITPKEFIFGKILGIWHNCREMIAVPLIAIIAGGVYGFADPASTIYSAIVFFVFVCFATILGIHAALRYDTTRLAISHSLGTMFLLFVGILVCLFLILVSGNDRFGAQWASFLLFIVLGSIGLWVSLSANAPSNAIGLTAGILPFATFYCVIAFLVGDNTGPLFCFLVATSVYGFAVASLLVPLLAEFDVATGRTSHAEGD